MVTIPVLRVVLVLILPAIWNITVVVFEVVDTPFLPSLSIDILVTQGTRVSGTGKRASVRVDSELES
jgi:Cu/Ag efflux pump CusA